MVPLIVVAIAWLALVATCFAKRHLVMGSIGLTAPIWIPAIALIVGYGCGVLGAMGALDVCATGSPTHPLDGLEPVAVVASVTAVVLCVSTLAFLIRFALKEQTLMDPPRFESRS